MHKKFAQDIELSEGNLNLTNTSVITELRIQQSYEYNIVQSRISYLCIFYKQGGHES